MMCADNRVHYGLMVASFCLNITQPHYHNCADLFEGFEPLKMRVKYILSSVCLRLS